MSTTTPAAPRADALSTGYKGAVLGLLLAAYTFNFIDRTIISTIGQAIKEDLKVSDAQLGLLGGLYFALLYTILGIPIARLAERYSRTWIITVSLVVWSGFTALCGTATSFASLAAMRFGVGIGEAGLGPSAHSLISDYYEPRKRASALSIYSFGIPLGTMVGAILGGFLAQYMSWRIAFMAVGLPGVILAVIFKLVVKEPLRGGADVIEQPRIAEDVSAPPQKRGLAWEFSEFGAVAKTLFGVWPVFNVMAGITVCSFASYGVNGFVPPFFIRTLGLGLAQAGLVFGLLQGMANGAGTILGGFLTDRLGKRNPAWYALVPAIGIAIACPLYITAYMQPTWQLAAAVLVIPGILHYTYLAPTFAVIQNSVDVRRRATATALLFFVLNLIALGGGPPFVGWLIDSLAQWNFAHPGQHGPLTSLAGIFGDHAAAFQKACPGGSAPKGSAAALVASCKATLSQSTRQGVVIGSFFYAWAALHYLLAAIGMKKHMQGRIAPDR